MKPTAATKTRLASFGSAAVRDASIMNASVSAPAPVVGAPFEVPSSWIDHNEHMNLARYADAFSWHELVLHDDTIAATGELLGLNISTATRRVSDMPSEALARLEELFAEHEQLPQPDGVSRSISLDT